MSKAKKNILFAALAALALTVCLVGVTGAYFIAQASRTNTLTVGEVTFDPKEDIQNPDVPVQPGNSFMKRPVCGEHRQPSAASSRPRDFLR